MAANLPYAQLTGTVTFYIAAASTAEPSVASAPGAAWTPLGCTEDDQTIGYEGPIEYFYDNCHQGPVKGVRPQEDVTVGFRLVDMTLENLARIRNSAGVSAVTTSGSNRVLPLKAGATLNEYALLMRGEADSPYGNFPAQTYIPRGVFEGEGEVVRGKAARAAIDVVFHVLEDDTQTSGNEMGWSTAKVS